MSNPANTETGEPMKIFAALLLVAALPAASIAQGSTEQVFSGQIPAGSWLRLRTMKGDIDVREARGNNVVVTARRRSYRGADREVRFEVKRDGNSVTICAIWERTRRCDAEGYESRSGYDRDSESADFTVELPRAVKLLAATGNGDVMVRNAGAEVEARSGNGEVFVQSADGRVSASSGNGNVSVDRATGPVNARSGNGDIRVSTTNGPVSASSGNGRIDVDMARILGDDDMEFTTGNGTIDVSFPANLSARIEANASYRDLRTDFPVDMPARWNARHIRGTIGNGGRLIRFSTGNGRINIRKNP
jgi:DUF4097 and DUF4098 domain-containing protein YvlB